MRWNRIPGIATEAVLFSLLLASGCSTGTVPPGSIKPAEGKLITAEQIKLSGARNAWEALKRSHVHLSLYESRNAQPVQLSRRRGLSAPLVIVDGTPTEGLQLLYLTPASDIASIRVLDDADAAIRYGPRAAGGAIILETKQGRRR